MCACVSALAYAAQYMCVHVSMGRMKDDRVTLDGLPKMQDPKCMCMCVLHVVRNSCCLPMHG